MKPTPRPAPRAPVSRTFLAAVSTLAATGACAAAPVAGVWIDLAHVDVTLTPTTGRPLVFEWSPEASGHADVSMGFVGRRQDAWERRIGEWAAPACAACPPGPQGQDVVLAVGGGLASGASAHTMGQQASVQGAAVGVRPNGRYQAAASTLHTQPFHVSGWGSVQVTVPFRLDVGGVMPHRYGGVRASIAGALFEPGVGGFVWDQATLAMSHADPSSRVHDGVLSLAFELSGPAAGPMPERSLGLSLAGSAVTLAVPEPGRLVLVALGLPVVVAAVRRRPARQAGADGASPR